MGEKRREPKAEPNPEARRDPPHPVEPEEERPERTRERQVKPGQGKELNPLDPGGIGE